MNQRPLISHKSPRTAQTLVLLCRNAAPVAASSPGGVKGGIGLP